MRTDSLPAAIPQPHTCISHTRTAERTNSHSALGQLAEHRAQLTPDTAGHNTDHCVTAGLPSAHGRTQPTFQAVLQAVLQHHEELLQRREVGVQGAAQAQGRLDQGFDAQLHHVHEVGALLHGVVPRGCAAGRGKNRKAVFRNALPLPPRSATQRPPPPGPKWGRLRPGPSAPALPRQHSPQQSYTLARLSVARARRAPF